MLPEPLPAPADARTNPDDDCGAAALGDRLDHVAGQILRAGLLLRNLDVGGRPDGTLQRAVEHLDTALRDLARTALSARADERGAGDPLVVTPAGRAAARPAPPAPLAECGVSSTGPAVVPSPPIPEAL